MSEGPAVKRQQLTEGWAQHYPQPLAELIATIALPFDDDRATLAAASLDAHRLARKELRDLFPGGGASPSGGQIEASLSQIANRLLAAVRADDAASLSADRLRLAIGLLGNVTLVNHNAPTAELQVPETAKRLDGDVPFAMWR